MLSTHTAQIAQIIPATFDNDQINALNNAIPAFVQSKNSTTSPIWIVNQNSGFTTTDLRDPVHPNASGDQKMAAKWYPALVQALNSLKTGQKFVA
jgi:lysophospholipase L1-like esterase